MSAILVGLEQAALLHSGVLSWLVKLTVLCLIAAGRRARSDARQAGTDLGNGDRVYLHLAHVRVDRSQVESTCDTPRCPRAQPICPMANWPRVSNRFDSAD